MPSEQIYEQPSVDQLVTLYFKTREHGEMPSLRAVALASLAFDAIAKMAASSQDPFGDVEVSVERTEVGSLKLIAKISGISTEKLARRAVQAIICTLLIQPASDFSAWAWDKLYDVLGLTAEEKNDQEEISNLLKELLKHQRSEANVKARQDFYRAVSEDYNIDAVGVVPDNPPGPPAFVVHRSDFSRMIEASGSDEEVEVERIKRVEDYVTLVSPVLSSSSKKQWEFSFAGRVIKARIEDQKFREKALAGDLAIQLAEGVVLKVVLRTDQKLVDGLWVDQSHAIERVLGWQNREKQGHLLSPDEWNQENDGDKQPK